MSFAVKDLFLLPGGLAFGGPALRLRTLLGSCVAVVVWHPELKLGGMCHYLLPERTPHRSVQDADGRYGEEALQLMFERMQGTTKDLSQFHAHVCGGANCFSSLPGQQNEAFEIGRRNIEAGLHWVQKHRLTLFTQRTGGTSFRHVAFDTRTGHVTVRQGTSAEAVKGGLTL